MDEQERQLKLQAGKEAVSLYKILINEGLFIHHDLFINYIVLIVLVFLRMWGACMQDAVVLYTNVILSSLLVTHILIHYTHIHTLTHITPTAASVPEEEASGKEEEAQSRFFFICKCHRSQDQLTQPLHRGGQLGH